MDRPRPKLRLPAGVPRALLIAALYVFTWLLFGGLLIFFRGECNTDSRPNGMRLCMAENDHIRIAIWAIVIVGYPFVVRHVWRGQRELREKRRQNPGS